MCPPDDDNTRTHVTLTSGTKVSHYRIIEKIGAGGNHEVILTDDEVVHWRLGYGIRS